MTDRSLKIYAGRLVQSPGFPAWTKPEEWASEIAGRWPRLDQDDRSQLATEMARRSANYQSQIREQQERAAAESEAVPPIVPGGGKRRIIRKPHTMGG